MLPPDWLKVEPELLTRFPLIFNVPPVTVNVPLLDRLLLFKVQPTVKSPDATVKVPPKNTVKVLELFVAELTVTLCPGLTETISEHVGTVPKSHVDGEFQFPEAIEL